LEGGGFGARGLVRHGGGAEAIEEHGVPPQCSTRASLTLGRWTYQPAPGAMHTDCFFSVRSTNVARGRNLTLALGTPGPATATRALRHVTTRTAFLHTHMPPQTHRAARRTTRGTGMERGRLALRNAGCDPVVVVTHSRSARHGRTRLIWACVGRTSRSGESSWCSIRRVSRHSRAARPSCERHRQRDTRDCRTRTSRQ